MKKDSFCSYCGDKFAVDNYPKTCYNCQKITYQNPLPVAALVQPIVHGPELDCGFLVIRRAKGLGSGKLALPGGYIEIGETAEQAAAREAGEEIGFFPAMEKLSVFYSAISTTTVGNLLLFCLNYNFIHLDSKDLKLTSEVSEIGFVSGLLNLEELFAFPGHINALKEAVDFIFGSFVCSDWSNKNHNYKIILG